MNNSGRTELENNIPSYFKQEIANTISTDYELSIEPDQQGHTYSV